MKKLIYTVVCFALSMAGVVFRAEYTIPKKLKRNLIVSESERPGGNGGGRPISKPTNG